MRQMKIPQNAQILKITLMVLQLLHAKKMQELGDRIYGKTLSNIQAAQEKDNYTITSSKVIVIWCML